MKPATEKAKPLLELGDDELRERRAQAEQSRAKVEKALGEVAGEIAAVLGAAPVDAERLGTLTAKRTKLEKDREKALALVAEVEAAVASWAFRRDAKAKLAERVEQYAERIADETKGHEILRGVLEALQRADAAMPWPHAAKHPMGHGARLLAEEIRYDARDAATSAPELPKAREFKGEIIALAQSLAARANPEAEHEPGKPKTERGKAELRARLEEREAAVRAELAAQQGKITVPAPIPFPRAM